MLQSISKEISMETVTSTVHLKWIDATLMAGMDSRGRTLIIGTDLEADPQWLGVKASDLLLLAAAACSTYDVINILTKQREPVQRLEVICSGEQNKEAPHAFTSLHLHYIVSGPVDPQKLEKAIHLSEDKYCSVVNTLRPTVEITHDYEIKS
jgi:putative redox protein